MVILQEVWSGVASQFAQALNEQGLILTPGVIQMAHKPGAATLVVRESKPPYVITFGHDHKRARVTIFEPSDTEDIETARKAARKFYLSIKPMRATA